MNRRMDGQIDEYYGWTTPTSKLNNISISSSPRAPSLRKEGEIIQKRFVGVVTIKLFNI